MTESNLPLVTLAVIAFNQERYVGDAVAAALAQTYSPLEIILSDDCSTDATFELMERAAAVYEGPHRLLLNRNPRNLNIGGHINVIATLARGELIVLAAGDDISLPMRTEKLTRHWLAIGAPPAVICSDFEAIDVASNLMELRGEMTYRGTYRENSMAMGDIRVLGATTAVSKQVFSAFPAMDVSVRHEDRVLPFRAMLLGGTVSLVDEKLVQYRVEGGISRDVVSSAAGYLTQLPAQLKRTLPDARQRLADLESVGCTDAVLKKLCYWTILDHEARIEIAEACGIQIEHSLLSGLRKGAGPGLLARLYLKKRFYPLFRAYFELKNRIR